MARRRCCGLIDDVPVCGKFVPEHSSGAGMVVLRLEELEALRLKDLKGLEQQEGARQMGLTRQTFQRVLQSARAKVAAALVEGHGILIEGGNYIVKNRVFECIDCRHTWEVEPCTMGGKHGYEIACPKCGSMKKVKLENGQRHACGGHHHGGCCGGH